MASQWIFQMVMSPKNGFNDAHAELVRTGQNLRAKLGDLEKWRQAAQVMQMQKRIAALQVSLRQQQRAFRPVPEINDWLLHYSKNQEIMDRKSF